MIFQESRGKKEVDVIIKAGLAASSSEYMFEFEIVNMNELTKKLKSSEDGILSVLSEKELNHFNNVKLEKNKIQWLSGRYAVKSALFKYKLKEGCMMDLKCVDVLKGQDSAPYIGQYPELICSITHSWPFCISVLSNKRIGIDIEEINAFDDSLIKYFYSEKEKAILMDCKDTKEYKKQSIVFWTRKEAVSKFLRLGMKMNFKELDTTKDRIIINNYIINVKSLSDDRFCLSLACE